MSSSKHNPYSMSDAHKEALRINRVSLVQQLVVDPVLLSALESTKTLTPSMKEEIEVSECTTIVLLCVENRSISASFYICEYITYMM